MTAPDARPAPLTAEQRALVESCLPLAVSEVHRQRAWLAAWGLTHAESLSFVHEVMVDAARTYNPAKGRPSTHFTNAIRCQLTYPGNAVAGGAVRLPRSAGTKHRPPTVKLLGAMRYSDEQSQTSLAETLGGLVDPSDPPAEAARREEIEAAAARVRAALRRLPARLRWVLVRRRGLFGRRQLTLVEVARVLRVSKARVQQLERKAMDRVRRLLGGAA